MGNAGIANTTENTTTTKIKTHIVRMCDCNSFNKYAPNTIPITHIKRRLSILVGAKMWKEAIFWHTPTSGSRSASSRTGPTTSQRPCVLTRYYMRKDAKYTSRASPVLKRNTVQNRGGGGGGGCKSNRSSSTTNNNNDNINTQIKTVHIISSAVFKEGLSPASSVIGVLLSPLSCSAIAFSPSSYSRIFLSQTAANRRSSSHAVPFRVYHRKRVNIAACVAAAVSCLYPIRCMSKLFAHNPFGLQWVLSALLKVHFSQMEIS